MLNRRGSIHMLFPMVEVQSTLSEVLSELGARVAPGAGGRLVATFADGGRVAFTCSPRGPSGDKVSHSILAAATRFRRGSSGTSGSGSRRDRILAQLQRARAVITAVPLGRVFPADALATLQEVARRTRAFQSDGHSLRDSEASLLLDRKGHVAPVIPDDWQLFQNVPLASPPAARLEAERLLLSWDADSRELEALAVHPPAGVEVAVYTEARDQRALANATLDLIERVETWRKTSPPERSIKVGFALARVKGIARLGSNGPWSPTACKWLLAGAESLRAWVLENDRLLDSAARLVLSADGAFDPDGGNATSVLLLTAHHASDLVGTVHDGLNASRVDLDAASTPLARALAGLRGQRLHGASRIKQQEVAAYLAAEWGVLVETVSGAPLKRSQIDSVLQAARQLGAAVFDGWGLYDARGRALLVRSGHWDPSASMTGAHFAQPPRPSGRPHRS